MTCLYLLKIRQKNNILADAGHFLRPDTHSKDIKNENLTTKIRRNNGKNNVLLKKRIQKTLKQTKPSNKIKNKCIKKYWTEK